MRSADQHPPSSSLDFDVDLLAAFRYALLGAETERSAAKDEARRRVIMAETLGRSDLVAVAQCLAAASPENLNER